MLNIMAAFHAYKFTHFGSEKNTLTQNPEKLRVANKISALVFGVSLPRPVNTIFPIIMYETYSIKNEDIECWEIPVANPKGNVLLFHGYGNKKSGMLDKAYAFHNMGYRVMMIDFRGSGGSKGNKTTIGFAEGEDVKTTFDFVQKKYPTQKIILMGSSMGAAAIMKCLNDNTIQPSAIILECPFGSMYKTVCNRFEAMNVPSFPMAGLLVFYGGIMNGFWAFDHNPIDYAKKITVPTLLLSGGSDERVSQEEINAIYANLQGKKQKIIYPKAKHESYLNDYANEWNRDVSGFLVGN
jgi:hypothetical protein